MALLTAPQRVALRVLISQRVSDRRELFGVSRADLDAAITAIDTWVENNATSYNVAIPQPARNALTASQKAELLYLISQARYGGN